MTACLGVRAGFGAFDLDLDIAFLQALGETDFGAPRVEVHCVSFLC